MKRTMLMIAGAAVMALTAMAQDEPAPREGGRGMAQAAGGAAIVRLADADMNGEVSSEEWTKFLDGVKSDKEGQADVAKVKDAYTMSLLDKNGDHVLTNDDLAKIFTAMDKDGDKKITREEMAPAGGRGGFNQEEMLKRYDANGDGKIDEDERAKMREDRQTGGGRRGQGGEGEGGEDGGERRARGGQGQNNQGALMDAAVVRKADADKNGEVTADEFSALVKSLSPDEKGVISARKAYEGLFAPAKSEGGDAGEGRGRGGMGGGMMLDRMLDADGDGKMPVEDLNKMFTSLDKNGDKTLQKDELQPARRMGGRGEGAPGGEGRRRREQN